MSSVWGISHTMGTSAECQVVLVGEPQGHGLLSNGGVPDLQSRRLQDIL